MFLGRALVPRLAPGAPGSPVREHGQPCNAQRTLLPILLLRAWFIEHRPKGRDGRLRRRPQPCDVQCTLLPVVSIAAPTPKRTAGARIDRPTAGCGRRVGHYTGLVGPPPGGLHQETDADEYPICPQRHARCRPARGRRLRRSDCPRAFRSPGRRPLTGPAGLTAIAARARMDLHTAGAARPARLSDAFRNEKCRQRTRIRTKTR